MFYSYIEKWQHIIRGYLSKFFSWRKMKLWWSPDTRTYLQQPRPKKVKIEQQRALHAPTTMLTWLRALFNTTPLRIWKKNFFLSKYQWWPYISFKGNNGERLIPICPDINEWHSFFVTRSFATRLMSPFLKSNCLNWVVLYVSAMKLSLVTTATISRTDYS